MTFAKFKEKAADVAHRMFSTVRALFVWAVITIIATSAAVLTATQKALNSLETTITSSAPAQPPAQKVEGLISVEVQKAVKPADVPEANPVLVKKPTLVKRTKARKHRAHTRKVSHKRVARPNKQTEPVYAGDAFLASIMKLGG